jgi:flavin reductase (DIM6/NTAB) family NADH-FMN oxidoreductase RutF
MEFDLDKLDPRDRYKLLVSVVVPRPIALVTTVDGAGRVNAAPFSFFNAIGSDPPLVVLGIGNRPDGEPKDTARNINETGEFVVNLVHDAMARAMNVCAVDFPAGTDELTCAGLTVRPSTTGKAPRIAEARVSLECRAARTVEVGRNRVILGEVRWVHIADEFVDPQRLHVHAEKLDLIARMHGAGWYARTTDLFEMPRMTVGEWNAESKREGGGSAHRD